MIKRTPRVHLNPPLKMYRLDQIHEAVAVLKSLDQFGGLTSWQVGRLHFHNRLNQRRALRDPAAANQAANKLTLKRLKTNGYVGVASYQIRNTEAPDHWDRNEASILTDDGRIVLANNLPGYRPESGSLTANVVRGFEAHEHLTNEVGVAIVSAAEWQGHTLVDWQSEHLLRSRSLLRTPGNLLRGVIPDAFFRLRVGAHILPFFLEFDNNSADLDSPSPTSIRSKLFNYADYLTHRWPDDRALHGTTFPRVLFVTTSRARLHSMWDHASHWGFQNAYWFAALDDFLLRRDETDGLWVDIDPIGAVWRKAATPGYVSLL